MLFYKNLPVLVTGGAGFIGSHLVENLVALGADVTVLDNLSTGKPENIKNLKQKIKFINGDIRDLKTCFDATKNKKIIFHLAAFVSVPESMNNPQECNDINVMGTFNLLESARLNNAERFIFSSSSAVYGNKSGICTENESCNPTSVYGLSKLLGEIYCKNYYEFFGLKTICLRYFNVYGERQNPNGAYAAVVAKFTHCMQNNEPIIVYGNGLQTRDFIPVQKVVGANLNLGKLSDNHLNGLPVNIASNKSITLLELIKQLQDNFKDYSGEIIFKPARQGDIEHSNANCTKYLNLITS